MKLTEQDYQSALKIWLSYFFKTDNELTFPGYIEVKLDELEEQKLKTPLYRWIQVPFIKDGFFKLGELYDNSGLPKSCNLSDLPNHFELVEPEPEPEPEKITWDEVVTLIENYKRKTHLPQAFYIELIKILERIKTDHLS